MLEISSVSKMYAPDVGLKNATFSVLPGDVLAIIGPNGSGKSTLLGVLSDRHHADSGFCHMDSQPLNTRKAEIGVLQEEPYLIETMDAVQYLKYIANLKCMTSFDTIDTLINYFDVKGFSQKKIAYLSQGQRKRIALITSLMTNPYLLILDEPTNGFDTQTILRLKKMILDRRAQSKITLLSSHVLDFVQSVATKGVFIRDGYVTEVFDVDKELERKYKEYFQIKNI